MADIPDLSIEGDINIVQQILAAVSKKSNAEGFTLNYMPIGRIQVEQAPAKAETKETYPEIHREMIDEPVNLPDLEDAIRNLLQYLPAGKAWNAFGYTFLKVVCENCQVYQEAGDFLGWNKLTVGKWVRKFKLPFGQKGKERLTIGDCNPPS